MRSNIKVTIKPLFQDEANGKHLGVWLPGFPELQVHQSSVPSGPRVQCSLHFAARGLEKILEDQKNNLNPDDVLLHQQLRDAISRLRMLAVCVAHSLGGKCSLPPPPPKMPEQVFERKQWSHTLLKSARNYLDWLRHKLQTSGIQKAKKKKDKVRLDKYLRGSFHQLWAQLRVVRLWCKAHKFRSLTEICSKSAKGCQTSLRLVSYIVSFYHVGF